MKLQVKSYRLQVKRLIVLIVTGIIGIGITAWATKPPELPSVVRVIRFLPAEANPYQKEYEEMLYPTVRISTSEGVGSGVIIRYNVTALECYNVETLKQCNTETYILTAAHVVGDESTVTVTFYSCHQDTKTQSNIEATVLITDTNKDLALIILNSELITPNYFAKLASRDYVPYLFTPVWVVGCSLGLEPRPSSGEICAICGSYWEISAPILPGNSGGPVYAKRSPAYGWINSVPTDDGNAKTHELIGIAVWVRVYHNQLITTMAGVVPLQDIYKFLDSYKGQIGNSAESSAE